VTPLKLTITIGAIRSRIRLRLCFVSFDCSDWSESATADVCRQHAESQFAAGLSMKRLACAVAIINRLLLCNRECECVT
jgi:hypothetical protein